MGHPAKTIFAGAIDIGEVLINREANLLVEGHGVKEFLVWLDAELFGEVNLANIGERGVRTMAFLGITNTPVDTTDEEVLLEYSKVATLFKAHLVQSVGASLAMLNNFGVSGAAAGVGDSVDGFLA